MGQSLVQIYVHVVFSTKRRMPFLRKEEQRDRLHAYLAGSCKNQKCPALIISGVADHVHLLCRLGKTIDIATLIRELKKESSEWAKQALAIPNFYWPTGYGAFSISPSHLQALKEYIGTRTNTIRRRRFRTSFEGCAKSTA
jgi:putative transposase